jgi:hypothetical protein
MITPVELAGLAVTGAAVITTIAGTIKNWQVIKECLLKIRTSHMVRFARRHQPYCSVVCQAPAAMSKILVRLDEMFSFIQITREISLETHGMALIDKCKTACEKEYMPQSEKDDLIHSFIPYVIGDGNGKVFNYVQMAINLATHDGGQACDVNLNEIVTREVDRYNKRKKVSA